MSLFKVLYLVQTVLQHAAYCKEITYYTNTSIVHVVFLTLKSVKLYIINGL